MYPTSCHHLPLCHSVRTNIILILHTWQYTQSTAYFKIPIADHIHPLVINPFIHLHPRSQSHHPNPPKINKPKTLNSPKQLQKHVKPAQKTRHNPHPHRAHPTALPRKGKLQSATRLSFHEHLTEHGTRHPSTNSRIPVSTHPAHQLYTSDNAIHAVTHRA